MTQNYKADELPSSIDDIPTSTAPLVVDNYLSRAAVVQHIARHTDADITPPTGRGQFTAVSLAALYAQHAADEQRHPRTIKADLGKPGTIQRLGDIFDFDTVDDQNTLRKSQMIHVLLVLATDWDPEPFELPSDPDNPGDDHADVPTLGAD